MSKKRTLMINKTMAFTIALIMFIALSVENARAEKIPLIELDGEPLHLIISSYPDYSDTWGDDLENKIWKNLSLRISTAMGSVFYDQGIQIHTTSYPDKHLSSKAREILHLHELLDLRDKHDAYGIVILRTEKTNQPRTARFMAELKLVETTWSKPSETDLKEKALANDLLKHVQISLDPNKETKRRKLVSKPIFTIEAEITIQEALDAKLADILSQTLFESLLIFFDSKHTVNRTTVN